MNVLIIGVGLIGGSFALALRDRGLAERIEGWRRRRNMPGGRSNGGWSTGS